MSRGEWRCGPAIGSVPVEEQLCVSLRLLSHRVTERLAVSAARTGCRGVASLSACPQLSRLSLPFLDCSEVSWDALSESQGGGSWIQVAREALTTGQWPWWRGSEREPPGKRAGAMAMPVPCLGVPFLSGLPRTRGWLSCRGMSAWEGKLLFQQILTGQGRRWPLALGVQVQCCLRA